MPRFSLIAVRDGDLINDVCDLADEDAANAWAMKEVVEAFRLDPSMFVNLDDVVPETDGLLLEELSPDEIAEGAIALLDIAADLFVHIARAPVVWESREVREFILAASRLTLILSNAGYADDRLRWP